MEQNWLAGQLTTIRFFKIMFLRKTATNVLCQDQNQKNLYKRLMLHELKLFLSGNKWTFNILLLLILFRTNVKISCLFSCENTFASELIYVKKVRSIFKSWEESYSSRKEVFEFPCIRVNLHFVSWVKKNKQKPPNNNNNQNETKQHQPWL